MAGEEAELSKPVFVNTSIDFIRNKPEVLSRLIFQPHHSVILVFLLEQVPMWLFRDPRSFQAVALQSSLDWYS